MMAFERHFEGVLELRSRTRVGEGCTIMLHSQLGGYREAVL
jgi:hypothetical protein